MIGIIGAMDIEIEKLQTEMIELKDESKNNFKIFTGKLYGHNVVLIKSGIGKTAAAMATQNMLNLYAVEKVIFTGVAGALDKELNVGDVLIGKDCVYHDVDVTSFGYKKGQLPEGMPFNFEADETLFNLAKEAKIDGLKIKSGRILTGDQFINKSHLKTLNFLTTELNGFAIEMEGAAVAHVCYYNKIPHLIIRSISDKADGDAEMSFDEFAPIAANNSASMIKQILEKF